MYTSRACIHIYIPQSGLLFSFVHNVLMCLSYVGCSSINVVSTWYIHVAFLCISTASSPSPPSSVASHRLRLEGYYLCMYGCMYVTLVYFRKSTFLNLSAV
ncbi:hypothetical protein F4779DRAFT_495594 [Xylariaceae sp. FL0662B]|nr:hypothetical protein F4779DRAFT_495594 [Xylariaceae sp. FL0662B]